MFKTVFLVKLSIFKNEGPIKVLFANVLFLPHFEPKKKKLKDLFGTCWN